jgi:hypothetical protein
MKSHVRAVPGANSVLVTNNCIIDIGQNVKASHQYGHNFLPINCTTPMRSSIEHWDISEKGWLASGIAAALRGFGFA